MSDTSMSDDEQYEVHQFTDFSQTDTEDEADNITAIRQAVRNPTNTAAAGNNKLHSFSI